MLWLIIIIIIIHIIHRIFFKKYYQPFFAQQLGLFILTSFDNDKRRKLIIQFFDFIYKKIGTYNFCSTSEFSDYYNECVLQNKLIHYSDINNVKKKINLELDLNLSYDQLTKYYKKNTIRNLEKSIKKDLSIVQNIKTCDFIYLYNNNVARHIDLQAKQINVISKIIDSCIEKKMGYLFGVLNKGRIIAGAFFISCFNRDILIFHATEKDFKDFHPITYLIDSYIKNKANNNKVLDFEGSNISGVYRFYSGFGAIENNYYLHILDQPTNHH